MIIFRGIKLKSAKSRDCTPVAPVGPHRLCWPPGLAGGAQKRRAELAHYLPTTAKVPTTQHQYIARWGGWWLVESRKGGVKKGKSWGCFPALATREGHALRVETWGKFCANRFNWKPSLDRSLTASHSACCGAPPGRRLGSLGLPPRIPRSTPIFRRGMFFHPRQPLTRPWALGSSLAAGFGKPVTSPCSCYLCLENLR